MLDFNLAYNPSCSYDPRGRPLAPPANRLALPVRAGERSARDRMGWEGGGFGVGGGAQWGWEWVGYGSGGGGGGGVEWVGGGGG